MKDSEILAIWNGPTSVSNRAKILKFAADVEAKCRDGQNPSLTERAAQLIAHRACHNQEQDTANGKLAGYCIVCGVPWPCEYAGKPPTPPAQEAPAAPDATLEMWNIQKVADWIQNQPCMWGLKLPFVKETEVRCNACGRWTPYHKIFLTVYLCDRCINTALFDFGHELITYADREPLPKATPAPEADADIERLKELAERKYTEGDNDTSAALTMAASMILKHEKIIDIERQRNALQAKLAAAEQDAKRLDFVQAASTGYGKGWIFRNSTRGRGMRLHETTQDGAQPTVRAAIDAAIKEGT